MRILLLFTTLFIGVIGFSQSKDSYKFIENKGQLPNNVLYHTPLFTGDLFLEPNKFTFNFIDTHQIDDFLNHDHSDGGHHHHHHNQPIKRHSYSMNFIGSSVNTSVKSFNKSNHYKNYYRGNDPSKWANGVYEYTQLQYQNIYPNIDLKLYSTETSLKYDFVVAPGADPNQIKIKYNDVKDIAIINEELVITLSTGKVRELKPLAYQVINGQKVNVDVAFVLNKNTLTFDLGDYSPYQELIIDPTFVFATLSGGTSDNWGFTATYDSEGNFYSGGIVRDSSYPTTAGAYSTTYSGGSGFITTDMVITKYDPSGATLVYSTFLGGTANDVPHSLVTDSQDNLLVLGTTSSANYPTTAGVYDDSFNGGSNVSGSNSISYDNGSDIVITKFNSDGTALDASTFMGGSGNDGLNMDIVNNYSDEVRGEIIIDGNDNVYVASSTFSTDFPTTAGSYSQTALGLQDAVVFNISGDLSTLNWGTYLGGNLSDAGYSIRVSAQNSNVYVCGGTQSNNLTTSASAINDNFLGGGLDGYVARISHLDGSLVDQSYLGTNGEDQAFILEIDRAGDIYVTGQTLGNYTIFNAKYSVAGSPQFIHKMTEDLDISYYSTTFGSGSTADIDISLTAFLVDTCQNVYVSGWGGNTNAAFGGGNTVGLPVTEDAYQSTTDGSDFYFFVMKRDADTILYGSFFGSSTAAEHVDGGTSRFDKSGVVYQSVCAACGGNTFPPTPGVWAENNGSTNCNIGSIKFELDYQDLKAEPNQPEDLLICSKNFTIDFDAGENPPPSAEWDFGDGAGTSDEVNPSYTYSTSGTFTVRFIAIDPESCKVRDTAFFDVTLIETEEFSAEIDFVPPPLCGTDSLEVDLKFTGTAADSIIWDMGNGDVFYSNDIIYHYKDTGTYNLSMVAIDTLCKVSDTIVQEITYRSKEPIKEVVIPNAFSPNGDGKNDELTIDYLDPDKPFKLEFYNRWGQLVYETFDPGDYWKGRNFDNTALKEGVYYYIINYSTICEPEAVVKNGYVHLFR